MKTVTNRETGIADMRTSAVAGIDHVMVRVSNAARLMNLFSEQLGLPVTWPFQQRGFADFGWVGLGNANLEIWEAGSNNDLPADEALPLFHGLALMPNGPLAHSLALLQARGIKCKPPRPYVTTDADGRPCTNYTNSVILDASSDRSCNFFCEWGEQGTIFPWKTGLSTHERRRSEMAALRAAGGGRLGVTGLSEVRIASQNADALEDIWREICGCRSGPLALGDGVVLTFAEGAAPRIEELTISVQSLEQASRVLGEQGLLGEASERGVFLDQSACDGLLFRFEQWRSA